MRRSIFPSNEKANITQRKKITTKIFAKANKNSAWTSRKKKGNSFVEQPQSLVKSKAYLVSSHPNTSLIDPRDNGGDHVKDENNVDDIIQRVKLKSKHMHKPNWISLILLMSFCKKILHEYTTNAIKHTHPFHPVQEHECSNVLKS